MTFDIWRFANAWYNTYIHICMIFEEIILSPTIDTGIIYFLTFTDVGDHYVALFVVCEDQLMCVYDHINHCCNVMWSIFCQSLYIAYNVSKRCWPIFPAGQKYTQFMCDACKVLISDNVGNDTECSSALCEQWQRGQAANVAGAWLS